MSFISNHNNNHHLKRTCSWKRIFLTLIFFNTFLGCIYYLNEHNNPERIISSTWKNVIYHEESKDKVNALQFIENILANEYNQNDLHRFYTHVKHQYSLGLKCTRQVNNSQASIGLNVTNDVRTDSRSTTTKNRLSNSIDKNSFHTDLNQYIIDHSKTCANQSIDLLIIVVSKPENYQTRDAIRRTWLSKKIQQLDSSMKIKYFFLLDFNDKLTHSIERENDLFQDIIQVDLPEQYSLVTNRVISIFEWSFRYCRTAKFLFKTDDDIFINSILLLKFVSPLINQTINNSFLISDMKLYGYQHVHPHVFRHAKDTVSTRYLITYDEYPCQNYPTFLSGYGYLISKKARDAILYTAYQDPEPFRISDVYLTGIIPDYLSIPLQSMFNYRIIDGKCEKFFQHANAFACASDSHLGISTSDIFRNYYRYWQMINKTTSTRMKRSIFF